MLTLFSIAPVCHGHRGGCGVRSLTCRSRDSAGMGRDQDCEEHQPMPFFFPKPPRSVCGDSPQMCPWHVWWGFAIQSCHEHGAKALWELISAWFMLAFMQSLNLLKGLPCFHFPEASSPTTALYTLSFVDCLMLCWFRTRVFKRPRAWLALQVRALISLSRLLPLLITMLKYCKVPCKRPLPCKRPPPTSGLKLCKGWCTKQTPTPPPPLHPPISEKKKTKL